MSRIPPASVILTGLALIALAVATPAAIRAGIIGGVLLLARKIRNLVRSATSAPPEDPGPLPSEPAPSPSRREVETAEQTRAAAERKAARSEARASRLREVRRLIEASR